MGIRTSENYHEFQDRLFKRLKAYPLQGLLMNNQNEFTAAVEAIEYEEEDDLTTVPFYEKELNARYVLAHTIGIPLYLILYMQGVYKILEVEKKNEKIKLVFVETQLTEREFIEWWKKRSRRYKVKH